MSKNVLYKNKQLYWIDLLKKNGNKTTHVYHNQLDMFYHLKSCTPILCCFLWLHRKTVISKPVQHWCMVKGLTSCGLHGYSLVSVLKTGVNPISWLFLNIIFLLFCFKCFFLVCFVVSVYYS